MSTTEWPYPGAHWWKFDFQTHTPASSDYGPGPDQDALKQRTHREWLMDFINAGVDCVAVTDHNCGDWIDPLKAELDAMRAEDLPGAENFHLFPGVELTINGAHFLTIFDPSASTRTIQDLLAVARCSNDENNAQAYCSASVSEVYKEVTDRGGLFIPAHVDLDRTGMFKVQDNHAWLDPILKLDGILSMEVCDSAYTPPACYGDAKLAWTPVLGSDAHHPAAPPAGVTVTRPAYPGSHYTWVKMGTHPSIEALRLALVDGPGVSIRRSDEAGPFDPFHVPDDLIEEIEISDARYMGRGTAETVRFSPWLNALIGGRGSGKSTVLHFLRLALRRDDDVLALPADSLPRRELERFHKVPANRGAEGALTDDSRVHLIYRHQEVRYRIVWPSVDEQHSVEQWDNATGAWGSASSQEIRDRFPVRIFSQGQIAALAGEQSGALLRLVDEAIDCTAWREQWEEQERGFFALQNRIRELEGKLQSRDRIVGQLEDVQRELTRFEEAGHAKVLKDYQARKRQEKGHEQNGQAGQELSDQLTGMADDITLEDVAEGVFDPDDPLAAEALSSIERIRSAMAAAVETVRKAGEELGQSINGETDALKEGAWQKDVDATVAAYDQLVEDLRAQGGKDPSDYGKLVEERQRLEAELKALASIEETLVERRQESEEVLVVMQSLRRERSEKRETFLREALSDNDYVRIGLQRYGREPFVARDSLRDVLGIDANPVQFEQEIYRPGETGDESAEGLIARLLDGLPDNGADAELEMRLGGIRKGLVTLAEGGEFSEVSGYLRNRLQKTTEQRPEFVDRILTWYPEDTLSVSYSPKGDGTGFRPIQQGSAGQRAAAMLAFLLAYGGEPIVVDQPEDDLDNHLIYRLVVQQMRANKQRRQIIAVTHNPNIVVNGDAEMVHVLDYRTGQCQVAEKGCLQDAAVRTEICRVMEGGEEAFEQRYRRIGKGGRHV